MVVAFLSGSALIKAGGGGGMGCSGGGEGGGSGSGGTIEDEFLNVWFQVRVRWGGGEVS